MKTVWIINEYAGSKYHGMVFRSYYYGRELVKRGYKVYVISGAYHHNLKIFPKITGDFTFEEIDKITYVWVDVPKYKNAHDKKRVYKWFKFGAKILKLPIEKMDKPDLIIDSSASLFHIYSANQLAKKYNAKLFFEVRDIWPLSLIELGGYSPSHPFMRLMDWLERYGYKHADKVISVLPNAKAHMMSQGMREDKFIYLPNGIALEDYKESTPLEEEIKNKIPKDKFLIGYAGTVGHANALRHLIDAAKMVKDRGYKNTHFVIVGNGKDKEYLKKMAKEYDLDNVTFIDQILKSQVSSLLEMLDVCYIGLINQPLFRFGVSPNKLFDYMMAAKPILYAINSGNKPVEEAGCGISVEAENPKAIAEGIMKLHDMSEEERRQMGERGKKYVIENHAYENLVERLIEAFEKSEEKREEMSSTLV